MLPAADFAAADDDFELKILPAALAAALPLSFLLPTWAKALPAADFAAADDDFELNVRLAALAALLLVRSLFARLPILTFFWCSQGTSWSLQLYASTIVN